MGDEENTLFLPLFQSEVLNLHSELCPCELCQPNEKDLVSLRLDHKSQVQVLQSKRPRVPPHVLAQAEEDHMHCFVVL